MATTNRLLVVLLLCAVCFSLTLSAHMTADLRTGETSIDGQGLEWLSAPDNRGAGECDLQGLLKITFNKNSKILAQIKMEFRNPTNYSFNIGDSETNDGWGGDAGTNQKNAEVFAFSNRLIVAGIYNLSKNKYEFIYEGDFHFTDKDTSTLVINVADNLASGARDDSSFFYLESWKLFALRDQDDSLAGNKKNKDVFLGLNRVVSDQSYKDGSIGSGLCRVELTWFDSLEVAWV